MSLKIARKSKARITIIDGIVKILRSPKTFAVIGKGINEHQIKTYLHPILIEGMRDIYVVLYPLQREYTIERKSSNAVLWEGNKAVTISNTKLFGVQHSPDFVIRAEGMRIAIEVKRGEQGEVVREALGQGLVYLSDYDFVILLLVDTSKDKKISDSLDNFDESNLIAALWEDFNIRFEVVTP